MAAGPDALEGREATTASAENQDAKRPPRPVAYTTTICLTTTMSSSGNSVANSRKCVSTVTLAMSSSQSDVTRDIETKTDEDFVPVIRSGGWADIGGRCSMEDAHVRIDDLSSRLGALLVGEEPGAFYGVFDGHNGTDAAHFVRDHLLSYILGDVSFPVALEDAIKHAFLQTDEAFAHEFVDEGEDEAVCSGTTALTALVVGRTLLVANAGDCRAVLSRRGKAVEMSRDHKACSTLEKTRIEALGGYVSDGYLNGQIAVARALGDWNRKGLKEVGVDGPLIAEPELRSALLTEEDEFLIIGCDGLWDVFTSQNAVDLARRELQQHNDPEICSKELVAEALRRNTCDNLTVVTVCFQTGCPPRLGEHSMPVRRSFSTEGLKSLQSLLNNCNC